MNILVEITFNDDGYTDVVLIDPDTVDKATLVARKFCVEIGDFTEENIDRYATVYRRKGTKDSVLGDFKQLVDLFTALWKQQLHADGLLDHPDNRQLLGESRMEFNTILSQMIGIDGDPVTGFRIENDIWSTGFSRFMSSVYQMRVSMDLLETEVWLPYIKFVEQQRSSLVNERQLLLDKRWNWERWQIDR